MLENAELNQPIQHPVNVQPEAEVAANAVNAPRRGRPRRVRHVDPPARIPENDGNPADPAADIEQPVQPPVNAARRGRPRRVNRNPPDRIPENNGNPDGQPADPVVEQPVQPPVNAARRGYRDLRVEATVNVQEPIIIAEADPVHLINAETRGRQINRTNLTNTEPVHHYNLRRRNMTQNIERVQERSDELTANAEGYLKNNFLK